MLRFLKNALTMKCDVASINDLVLSHNHIDHTGGLNAFCKINSHANICIMDGGTNRYYVKIAGFIYYNVGLHVKKEYVKRICAVNENREIQKNVWFINNTSNTYPKPVLNKNLYMKSGEGLVKDAFEHEGLLVIEDNGEIVIFNSCSHNGILNSIDTVEKQFNKKVRAYAGGLHFANPIGTGNESIKEVKRVCAVLKEKNISVYTGHCTGQRNIDLMKNEIGDLVIPLYTGMRTEI